MNVYETPNYWLPFMRFWLLINRMRTSIYKDPVDPVNPVKRNSHSSEPLQDEMVSSTKRDDSPIIEKNTK